MKFCIGDEALILNGEHKGEKGIISFHYPIEKRYTINPVNAICEDANGLCAICGKNVELGTVPHHRKPRGMGGSRDPFMNSESNAMLLCSDCRHKIELKEVKEKNG